MNRISILPLFIVLLTITACSNMPDHARYIPKDAIVVVGLNTKEIGKKIAWNAIMGSKLLEEMQKEKTGDAITDPAEIGIEMMSTSYVYIKEDKRFNNGSRITALVPLQSREKWEAFVKKSFGDVQVKQEDKFKQALLTEGMYAGWSDNLLILMNSMNGYSVHLGTDSADTDTAVAAHPVADPAQLAAEMDKAFTIVADDALTKNDRFTKMERDAHDITLWINYDGLMDQYMSGGGNMMGVSLSGSLWKNSALSAGFDFEKGKIAGDILYYVPESLKQVGEELGKTDADKEMIERMPVQNLDMLMAWHLSPAGVKGLLEKTGVLGFINLALAGQDLSADYVLGAFTGDMAVALNDFSLVQDTASAVNNTAADSSYLNYSPDLHFTYALKIDKKENFNKLLQMAQSAGVLTASGNNIYQLKGDKPVTMAINEHYCVVTNHPANATGYLQGSFKAQPKPQEAKDILGNPFGIYFNAQGMMNGVKPGTNHSERDLAMLAESRKLLKDVHFKGGSFKSEAFNYRMSINFVNQSENSLLQLMGFSMRMNKARAEALTAYK